MILRMEFTTYKNKVEVLSMLVIGARLWYIVLESCGRTVAKITLLRFFFRKLIEQMFLKCLANSLKQGMIKLSKR